jgi:glycosyltransferase involved in cell wall biosynthesis
MIASKKICFLQADHLPDDDRVWFHQAKLLRDTGFDVSVISTRTDSSHLENVFCFDDTAMKKSAVGEKISEILHQIKPDMIICDNPLAVFFASKYKKKQNKNSKLIMDITEWYPSKKNLANLTGLKRIIKKMILKCLNFYSGFLADGFVFGEYHKAKFFKKYFKKKPFVDLPYYPDLSYIKRAMEKNDYSRWNFLYCGLLNTEKGFDNVINAIKTSGFNNPEHHFTLNVISKDVVNEEQKSEISNMPSNVEIKFHNYLPFEQFCTAIAGYDLFFDLRKKDKENNQCLPIKLFYYMACARPVIFSDLDAIELQVPEINEFACLTNPDDYGNISQIVTEYIRKKDKYCEHSAAAGKYSIEKYNWEIVSGKFLKFISDVGDSFKEKYY